MLFFEPEARMPYKVLFSGFWNKLKSRDVFFLFRAEFIHIGKSQNNTVLYISAIEQFEKKHPMYFVYSVHNLFISVKNKPPHQGQLIAASDPKVQFRIRRV